LLPYLVAKAPIGRRWIVGVAAVVSLYGIWISGSRASLVVLLVLGLMFPLLERSLKASLALAFVGLVVVANLNRILGSSGGSNALSRLLGNSGAKGSNIERERGLENAITTIKAHPVFGAGFDFDTFLAHNIYAQVAAYVGLVGLAAMLLVLYSFVAPLFSGPRPYRLLAYPALAFVVAGPITPNIGSRYVGVLLALAFVVTGMDDEDDEGPVETRRSLRRAAATETAS
jgi:O-antigen ligase